MTALLGGIIQMTPEQRAELVSRRQALEALADEAWIALQAAEAEAAPYVAQVSRVRSHWCDLHSAVGQITDALSVPISGDMTT